MIDSTNPRILANNIRKLFAKIIGLEAEIEAITPGSEVVANPEGEASGSLSSLGIDGDKYTIDQYIPVNYSTTAQDTGKKWTGGETVYLIVYHLANPITLNGNWQSTGISIAGKTIISNLSAAPLYFGTYEDTLMIQGTSGNAVSDIVVEYIEPTPASNSKRSKK